MPGPGQPQALSHLGNKGVGEKEIDCGHPSLWRHPRDIPICVCHGDERDCPESYRCGWGTDFLYELGMGNVW